MGGVWELNWSRGCAACRAGSAVVPWPEPPRWRRRSCCSYGAAPPGDADPSFGVLHGLYWLVVGLAEGGLQLLVVDDLHWADGASVRFMEFPATHRRRRPR